MNDSPQSIDREARLEQILDEAAERARQGEPLDVEEYAARHPDFAEEIRETLPVLVRLEHRPTVSNTAFTSSDLFQPGYEIDDFRLVRFLGRGGMGVVYEADQLSLDRRVALKLLPAHSREVGPLRTRFDLEARTAARLIHPHIVAVYQSGEAGGFAFYAMQYVDGMNLDVVVKSMRKESSATVDEAAGNPGDDESEGSLATALAAALRLGVIDGRGKRSSGADGSSAESDTVSASPSATSSSASTANIVLPPDSNQRQSAVASQRYFRSVARIGSLVADALAYAHSSGVIHRDIKPSNLLLDRQGKVWVADFGLAKLADGDGLTQSGDAVGTLRYMGPERFRGWSDPRSDVYSLGATLFELATLQPPFDDRDRARLMQKIVETDPPHPRSLDTRIPRDLETIILKCLAKEPAQRYATAEELRDDLERFLAGEPVRARLATPLERAWLFARRNPVIAGLGVAFAAAAVIASAVALRLNATATELEKTAAALKTERNLALERLWEAQVERARASRSTVDSELRAEALDLIAEAASRKPSVELRNAAILWLTSVGSRAEEQTEIPIRSVATISRDGETLLWTEGHEVVLESLSDGSKQRISGCERAGANEISMSPDGAYIERESYGGVLEIVGYPDGRCVASGNRGEASFHPHLPLVSVRDDTGVVLLDLVTGVKTPLPQWARGARRFVFGPLGERVAVVDPDGRSFTIRDATTGARLLEFEVPETRLAEPIANVVWHPEEKCIATGPRPLMLWDLETGLQRIQDETRFLRRLVFSADGNYLATTSWPGSSTSRIFDAASGQLLARLRGRFLGFGSSERDVFVREGTMVHRLRLLRNAGHRLLPPATRGKYRNRGLAFDPSGRWLAAAHRPGVELWDTRRFRLVATLPVEEAVRVRWSNDGSELIVASNTRGIWRWPWRASAESISVGPPIGVHGGKVAAFAVGPRNEIATVSNFGHHIHVQYPDDPDASIVLTGFPDAAYPSFSEDGRLLACGNNRAGTALRVWDLQSQAVVYQERDPGAVTPIFLKGSRLFIGTDYQIRVLDVSTWKVIHELQLKGRSATISPDRTTLAALLPPLPSKRKKSGAILRLLDVDGDLETLADFEVRSSLYGVETAALGSGGRLLAAGIRDRGSIELWRLDVLRPRLRELGVDWDPPLQASTPVGDVREIPIHVDAGPFDPDPGIEVQFQRVAEELEKRPNDPDTLHRYRVAAAKLGRLELAIAAYESALEEAFDNKIANNLAWILVMAPGEHRDLGRAFELAKRSVEADSTYWPALNTLGVIYVRRREWPAAVETLQKSVLASPGSKYIPADYYPLAVALHHVGDETLARVVFDVARTAVTSLENLDDELREEYRTFHLEAAAVVGDERPLPESLEE